MNIRTLYGATLLCLTAGLCAAQSKPVGQYSYISDRTFTSPEQLMGYDFKPAMREVPGEEPEETPVGKYSFGITRKNLYVEGPEIRGVYSVNAINTTEYGFILNTMNARDPTIQGHLKIVVDDLGQVEGLIFKRSTHEKEVIFFLRVISEEVAAAEALYFTNKGEKRVAHVDSLWTGVEVRPFLRIFQNMGGIQQRILPTDSVYLHFYKVTTVEEKKGVIKSIAGGKRDKGEKRKRLKFFGQPDAAPAPDTTAPADVAIVAEKAEAVAALDSAAAAAQVTPQAPADADALLGNPFDSTAADVVALPGVDSLALPLDSLAQVAPDSLGAGGVTVPDSLAGVKLKVTTKYYVDLNSFMRYDDGTAEMQHKTFLVNGMLERENPGARSGGDRYQWELNLHKRPNAYIYLDERRRVNSVQIDGQKFYLRGQ